MPTYTYRCQNPECSKIYDQAFPYTQKEKPQCPNCKSKKYKKVISVAPFVRYIGDGFTKKTTY